MGSKGLTLRKNQVHRFDFFEIVYLRNKLLDLKVSERKLFEIFLALQKYFLGVL